jgi:hypothetical protein
VGCVAGTSACPSSLDAINLSAKRHSLHPRHHSLTS